MPADETTVQRIFDKLDDVRERLTRVETLQTTAATNTGELKASVLELARNGCARSGEHDALAKRVEMLEIRPDPEAAGTSKWWIAAATSIGSAIGATLSYFASPRGPATP